MHFAKSIPALLLFAAMATAAQNVAVIVDSGIPYPARYGVIKLENALRAKGLTIVPNTENADYIISVDSHPNKGSAESLIIHREQTNKKPLIALSGGDGRGLMYAALDTAEKIAASPAADPFSLIKDSSETPFLKERGISTYTMQRAYFEQRLYDERYWTRYFDMLAADRINSFVVIFGYENGGFMAPLYPYFFNTPGFPGVELVGLTAEQQAKNTAAFKALIRIAHQRGIDVTAGIWDHIYRGGVQGGGIPGASENAGKRIPGLVFGVTAENLSDYTKASLRRFLDVFPELDGIQLRMHDESGLKHEEIVPFWHEVFTGIKRDHPNVRIDLRAKELPDAVIEDAVHLGLASRVSTKYWMEQMGLPFPPTHINAQNQKERRHGYADLLRYPQVYRIHWQLWNGGTTRVLLWGDPDYARRFAESVRIYDGQTFELNEMLATKMLGEPHDKKPLEILNPKYRYYDYEFERYWHFYRVWGRLSYNPKTDPQVWSREFDQRFGAEAGPHVMQALHLASGVLPRVVAASYLYSNFPTTRGWAEMNRQGSLPQYAKEDGSDIQQFMNVRDEAKSILAGIETPMRRPEETSRWFVKTADGIDAQIAQAEKGIGSHSGNEFLSTVTDLKILAGLARYHSWRLLAGVQYNLYKQGSDLAAFDEAVSDERHALESWKQIVDAAGDVYNQNLAFGAHAVGFARHWKEEYALLQRDFEQLQAERAKATATPGATHHALATAAPDPPKAELLPMGKDYVVSARVTSPSGVKSVRLRYRHVTQVEDYQTAEMTLDPKTGNYTGQIPASFIDPKWDLMYFIETIGNNGAGRMYPDLEVQEPFVIVPVRRP